MNPAAGGSAETQHIPVSGPGGGQHCTSGGPVSRLERIAGPECADPVRRWSDSDGGYQSGIPGA